jgi:L-asparaginase II
MSSPYLPVFELTRGDSHESVHLGAIALVNIHGQLIASYGDPWANTFLRSSAKPFQILPFLERGGQNAYNLTLQEIAIMCASHSGTDQHVAILKDIHKKASLTESQLLCGVHPPIDSRIKEDLIRRGEQPTPYRHNCSGKHSGMLAYAHLLNLSISDYIDPNHPVQISILNAFAEMSVIDTDQILLGTDGCSAPNFAVPLYNSAFAYARLCDPDNANPPLDSNLGAACRTVTTAMISHPDLVAGPERFDTDLMSVTQGRLVSKGGAEGYQAIGLLPGALGTGSPAIGIAFKIADGDPKDRARPAVALEILGSLGILSLDEMEALARYGPITPLQNWRKLTIGEARPCFKLTINREIINISQSQDNIQVCH